MSDPHDEIARLEAEIEALAAAGARCRKIHAGAKIAMAAGAAVIAVTVLGLLWVDTAWWLAAIAAIIGGVVAFGSNTSSWREIRARQAAAEARRAELIDTLDMHILREPPRRLN